MSTSLRHYACGRTSHNLAQMFRGSASERRQFPSGVFLFNAGPDRRVLFDTGYATGAWNTGLRGAAYRRLLPPVVTDADDIAVQLEADGVDPATITHVVLSHLHPDHIGGVRRFRDARFILTAGQQQTLAAPRLREGLLPGLLPEWFPGADTMILAPNDFTTLSVGSAVLRVFDLFGDGSYRIVDLPGHAAGHVGALVEGCVLIAADAAWGADLIADIPQMRTVPRAVQHDYTAYVRTGEVLAAVADAGIRVVCSHDPVTSIELLA